MALGILQDETTGQTYDPNVPPDPAPTSQAPTTYAPPPPGAWPPPSPWNPDAPVPATPKPSAPAPSKPGAAPPGFDPTKWNDPTLGTSYKYIVGRILAGGGTIQQAAAAVGARVIAPDKIQFPDGVIIDVYQGYSETGTSRVAYNQVGGPDGADPSGGSAAPGSGGSAAPQNPFPSAQTGTQFDDPVTKEWEGMLRQLVDKLNTPQPMWSNSQLDLMQTQALDPLERQRTAAKQQAQLRLAQRGITPGSGIFEQSMRDIDNEFDQMRTRTQAGFATNAVGREDQLFQNNEQRNVNAVNMFKQIPQYADSRLALAMNALTPSNPYQLLSLQSQIQNQNQQNSMYQQAQQQQQDQQLMYYLMQIFGDIL